MDKAPSSDCLLCDTVSNLMLGRYTLSKRSNFRTDRSNQQLILNLLCSRGSSLYNDLTLTLCSITQESKEYLLCIQKRFRSCPPAGLFSIATIVVSDVYDYELHLLLETIDKGRLSSVDKFINLCLKRCSSSGYKFCPGLVRNYMYMYMGRHASSVDKFINFCLKICSSSGYKFCPGIVLNYMGRRACFQSWFKCIYLLLGQA